MNVILKNLMNIENKVIVAVINLEIDQISALNNL